MPGLRQAHFGIRREHIDEVAAHYELPVLAKLPIDPKLAAAVDAGKIEDAKLPEHIDGCTSAAAIPSYMPTPSAKTAR